MKKVIISFTFLLLSYSSIYARDCSNITPSSVESGTKCDYGQSFEQKFINKIRGGANKCNPAQVKDQMKQNFLNSSCKVAADKLKKNCSKSEQAQAAASSFAEVSGDTNSSRTSANIMSASNSMDGFIKSIDSQSDKCADAFIEFHSACEDLREKNIELANSSCGPGEASQIREMLRENTKERVQKLYCTSFKNHIYNRMAQVFHGCQNDNLKESMKKIDKSQSYDL